MVGRPAQSSGHSLFISVKARATGAGAPGDVLGHLLQGAAGTPEVGRWSWAHWAAPPAPGS